MTTEITIGFEMQTYTFVEPNPGTSQLIEEVCVEVSDGELGRDITVNVIWTPGTATCE